MVRFDLLSRAHLLVQKSMVDSAGLVPIAKAKDMVKGSILTLSEIEAGGKEYLRTDGYDKDDRDRSLVTKVCEKVYNLSSRGW